MDLAGALFAATALLLVVLLRPHLTFSKKGSQLRWRIRKISSEDRVLLNKHFEYYRILPPRSQKLFEQKVARFIQMKQFIPRGSTRISWEMKLFISSSAVQLTFGLPDVYLSHFTYILVYPDNYYSTITQQYHKGEVNPRHQAIVLSWKAFVEGYTENDGINLGLHELAHALHLENRIRNSEFGFLPMDALTKWDIESQKEIESIRTGKATFFRSYAGSDRHEFFAVAVENYFERPAEFYAHNPVLYGVLCTLLNQNPLLLMP